MNDVPRPTYSVPFIGRKDDLVQIAMLLREPVCRLLTLVGPGGIGKTRLASEIEYQLADYFEDGVYFVPLQPLQAVDSIVTAIVDALPLRLMDNDDPQQRLLDYLREKHLLLVLDNFEHLLNRVDIVIDILHVTTRVQLLVTSRERLNLRAEQVWMVTGLTVPVDTEDAPDTHSAVQLFVERARRVQPYFSLETQKENVVRICRLVDGLPLALELAAAWTRVLDCKAIADEVQRNIDVLISSQRDLPERHQSMRAVFDHSWRLLAQEERAVLPKMTVFRGGFTMDAARYVAGASLHTLASLIDKSLVRMDEHGRYDLHELVRQYAHEALEATDAGESTRGAHSAYYAAFVHDRAEDLKGRRQIEAITEISADFGNVRTVWTWAVDHRHEDLIAQMIEGLWIYCKIRHCERDGFPLFQYAEQKFAPKQGDAAQRLWGRLLARSAAARDSRLQIETALAIARRFNDLEEIAFCLARSGDATYANREYDKAIPLYEQSLVIYRQLGDRYHIAAVLTSRHIYDHQTTWDDKQTHRDEMLRLRHEIGDRVGISYTLNLAALNEGRVGNFAEAERLWRERIALGEAIGDLVLVALSHAHISCEVKFIWGDFANARAAADAAISLGTRLGAADAIGWATATLGLLASMNENYAEGKRLCQQSAGVAQLADIGKLAAWGIAVASCGLRDYDAASAYLSTAFNFLTDVFGLVGEIASLPIAAVCTHQRDPARAVELLALAFTHPVKASGWMQKWPLLNRLQSDLEQTLGSESYSAAWERGRQQNLSDVMTEMRTQFFGVDTASQRPTNASLPDPLSLRELDVLTLIADGLTNREIADQLVIGVSTVKKHIQHIYEKLNAKTRTGAVTRARELHLLS